MTNNLLSEARPDAIQDFQALFESVPSLCLVLDPKLVIVAVSDAYAKATLTKREEIIGRGIFDVFPDNPDDSAADGVRNLKASLFRVLKSQEADAMAVQKYDIRKPEAEGGGFEVRYWSPLNSPVFNKDGILINIIHRVEDVTEFVQLKQKGIEQKNLTEELRDQAVKMEAEIYARARDVAEINIKLKNTELALKKSEQRYQGILQDQTDFICRFKADATILYVNDAFCRLFGKSSKELVGHKWQPVVVPEDLSSVENKLGQLTPSNPVVTVENRVVDAHGDIRWGQFVNRAFYDQHGSLTEIQSVGRDITEHKKLEDALSKNEKELRLLAEAMPQIVWITRPDGWNIYFNQQWVTYTGLTLEESYGHGWSKPFHPDDQKQALDAWQNAVNNHATYSLECRLRRADGEYKWWLIRGKPVLDQDGNIYKWFGTCTDINDIKQAEQTQKKLIRSQRLLSECSTTLIHAEDEQALLNSICRLAVETGGYLMAWVGVAENDTEQTVRPIAQFGFEDGFLDSFKITWSDTDLGLGPCGTAIRTKATSINQNCLNNPLIAPWRDEAIKRGYRSSIALPLFFQQQALGVLALYSATTDAFSTEEVQLLEELAENLAFGIEMRRDNIKRVTAEAATKAKSQFLANMSHEIRTPMNAILGIAHLMQRDVVTPKQAEQLDKIDTAAQHLLAIINDILDLSKIEAGKFTLEETDIVISDLMNRIVSILTPQINAKGLRLIIDAEHMPKHLLGDPMRISQALLNFANNAIKFTEKGSITIRARVLNETDDVKSIRFEVTDTGVGIKPDQLDRLFTAFEQGDNSTTRQYGGSGLGLAITKYLAGVMGGEVGVSSTLGVGSSFWFTVKLKKNVNQSSVIRKQLAYEEAETIILRDYHGRRVLLAEDDPINQEIALEQLRLVGLTVDVADDGKQAVNKAQLNEYDLILMDMQMPEMDGPEATSHIRTIPGRKTVPIIAMTANAFNEDRERCLQSGMNDFLPKPVELNVLYATLLQWLKTTYSN